MDSVAFFDRTYEEALALARDARDYLAQQGPVDRAEMTPFDQLTESCEAMRLTARITQVIAWLLVQKAIHAGELTRADARKPENRLAGHQICATATERRGVELPPRLRDLLVRSHGLYTRIDRLDGMLART